MAITIDEYYCLSISDLKRLGFLKPNVAIYGRIRWIVDGVECAAVGAATDTRGLPVLKLAYTVNNEHREAMIKLMWKNSNLNPDATGGYYYFVCPVTGYMCRNLYIVNGEFVGRKAFRPLYRNQTLSHSRRKGGFIG